jgi:hypothetical protein
MKFNKPQYISHFVKNNANITLNSGESVIVYSISNDLTETELNEWAKHILMHYIPQDKITNGAVIHNISEQKYIEDYVLPSVSEQTKDVSGNFGEIVFCDFIEFVLGYSVPRYKFYDNQRGNPTQGIDIVAYKMNTRPSPNDTILYAEVKASLSKVNFNRLQNAINDIEKRKDKDFALALNTAWRKLESIGNIDESNKIKRFLDSETNCKRTKSAGLITAATACSTEDFVGVNISNGNTIETHVIYAPDLWELAKDLWKRASL